MCVCMYVQLYNVSIYRKLCLTIDRVYSIDRSESMFGVIHSNWWQKQDSIHVGNWFYCTHQMKENPSLIEAKRLL